MRQVGRFIFHLDMDHFFTAVEVRERPELLGKPVVVGADPKGGKGRGVVSTSSYEARRAGVYSGIPISQAWQLCPEAVYLRPNYPLYKRVSKEIMAVVQGYADGFEQWGLDEAFLDVSSRVADFGEAEALARQIKLEILRRQRLTCSVGVGANKLVAKVASDYQKPDGLTVVRQEEAEAFLAPLPVRKLLWVGRKTEAKLKTLGVETIGDLAGYDPTALTDMFGVTGKQIYLMAQGIDRSEIQVRSEAKSISHETTFEEDTADPQILQEALYALNTEVAQEATGQHLFFKTITVKVRYQNFETHTKSKTLPFMTNRPQDLQKTAQTLLQPYLHTGRKIRLIGVRVSSLVSGKKQQTLF
ncbi:MAG: DNA polymerase IV [Candidatus Bathyarchaeota archaeon]|nr:DNA polymerase IV [Candidatus Bathyarchaeota archaeon]